MFKYNWRDTHVAIRHVDTAARTLSTGGTLIGANGIAKGGVYYAYNLAEELDVSRAGLPEYELVTAPESREKHAHSEQGVGFPYATQDV